MRSRSTGLLVLIFAIATIGAGCSSGDSEDTAISTSSITRAEFVRKANAICKPAAARLLNEVTAYQNKHINEVSVKLIPDTARTIIKPALLSQIDEVRRLGAPRGDAEELEGVFASLLRGVDEIIAQKGATTFGAAEVMLQAGNDAARSYGIGQCRYSLVK